MGTSRSSFNLIDSSDLNHQTVVHWTKLRYSRSSELVSGLPEILQFKM